jgi:2-oxoglutarate dehydrogenase complex dehydrogenase (E1) component-like enzyme
MIERYRSIGHQFAAVDPLKIKRTEFVGAVSHNELDL